MFTCANNLAQNIPIYVIISTLPVPAFDDNFVVYRSITKIYVLVMHQGSTFITEYEKLLSARYNGNVTTNRY